MTATEAAAIIEAYKRIGNIKKTAKHLHISQNNVSDALHEAGVIKPKTQPNSSKSICFTCGNAFAHKCAFIAASIDKAESILQAAGAEYKSRIYTSRDQRGNLKDVTLLTVLDCPKHKGGAKPWWQG